MKHMLTSVISMLVCTMLASVSLADGHGGKRFFGLWEGIDTIDGSTMQRSITKGPDGMLKIVGREDLFSYCSGGTGIILGTGTAEANRMVAQQSLKCTDGSEVDTSAIYEIRKEDRTLVETPYDTTVQPFIYHRIDSRN
jgi:hypothetical protein